MMQVPSFGIPLGDEIKSNGFSIISYTPEARMEWFYEKTVQGFQLLTSSGMWLHQVT